MGLEGAKKQTKKQDGVALYLLKSTISWQKTTLKTRDRNGPLASQFLAPALSTLTTVLSLALALSTLALAGNWTGHRRCILAKPASAGRPAINFHSPHKQRLLHWVLGFPQTSSPSPSFWIISWTPRNIHHHYLGTVPETDQGNGYIWPWKQLHVYSFVKTAKAHQLKNNSSVLGGLDGNLLLTGIAISFRYSAGHRYLTQPPLFSPLLWTLLGGSGSERYEDTADVKGSFMHGHMATPEFKQNTSPHTAKKIYIYIFFLNQVNPSIKVWHFTHWGKKTH